MNPTLYSTTPETKIMTNVRQISAVYST